MKISIRPFIFLSVSFFVSLTSFANTELTNQYDANSNSNRTSSSKTTSFNYEDLVSLIKSKNLSSVESVLPYFPENMRKNFLLIRDSLSLQKSDDLHPRAILFGQDATLTCSFGGHESLDGFNSIECFQFRESTAKFEFHEIVFPTRENGLNDAAFSLPNRQAIGAISCAGCHTQDPRPNWEPYSRWKGAYGSFDDSFNLGIEDDRSRRLNPAAKDINLQNAISKEKKAFKGFKATYKNSQRYSQLIFPEGGFSPFSAEHKSSNYEFRPNLRFTEAISNLMVKRNLRKLAELPFNIQIDFVKATLKCKTVKLTAFDDLYPSLETADILRQSPFSISEWTPAFRTLNPNCEKCENNGGDPNKNRVSSIQNYIYETGAADLNLMVASKLVNKFVELGLMGRESLEANIVKRGNGLPQKTLTSGTTKDFEEFDKKINQERLDLCSALESKKN
jgi:hypothetical protein